MSMKQEFMVILPSNVKSLDSEENTVTNYKTQLKRRLEFPSEEKWKVGLASISYPKTWFNVRDPDAIQFVSSKGVFLGFFREGFSKMDRKVLLEKRDPFFMNNTLEMKPGVYENVDELLFHINSKMKYFETNEIKMPLLIYDKIQNRVVITNGSQQYRDESVVDFIPYFGEEIENILGLIDDNKLSLYDKIRENNLAHNRVSPPFPEIKEGFDNGYFVGPHLVDMMAGFSSMYVYSDIVQHSFVGDEYAQILRNIPVSEGDPWGKPVQHVYGGDMHLYPLQSRSFDTIEIDVRDDTGAKIPFRKGKIIVTLIFREYV